MAEGSVYADGWYWSSDGLRLHFRDYPGDPRRPALLCLPGLTRNARDFEGLGVRLAGRWRVLAPDLRGRGESAHAKDPLSYVPLTYVQDLSALLEAAGAQRVVLVGTSLGGLLAMLLPAVQRARIAGVVLNDVGPVLEPEGIARVRANVGRTANWPSWMHAARDLRARNGFIYPRWGIGEWLVFAKRLCRLSHSGRIAFDYDPRIAEPFRLPGNDSGIDMWAALDGLAGVPALCVRGALSDMLSAATVAAMAQRLPRLRTAVVPDVGHAPTLEEPEAVAAIDALLAEVAP